MRRDLESDSTAIIRQQSFYLWSFNSRFRRRLIFYKDQIKNKNLEAREATKLNKKPLMANLDLVGNMNYCLNQRLGVFVKSTPVRG
jgi:hypothetical protein